jgi:hypothetical protein
MIGSDATGRDATFVSAVSDPAGQHKESDQNDGREKCSRNPPELLLRQLRRTATSAKRCVVSPHHHPITVAIRASPDTPSWQSNNVDLARLRRESVNHASPQEMQSGRT